MGYIVDNWWFLWWCLFLALTCMDHPHHFNLKVSWTLRRPLLFEINTFAACALSTCEIGTLTTMIKCNGRNKLKLQNAMSLSMPFYWNVQWLTLRPSDAYSMLQQTCHHWFKYWLVAWSAPSHYLNQFWNVVDLTNLHELQWNISIEIHTISFKKMLLKSRLRNVNHFISASI